MQNFDVAWDFYPTHDDIMKSALSIYKSIYILETAYHEWLWSWFLNDIT